MVMKFSVIPRNGSGQFGGMSWLRVHLGHRDDPNTFERELGELNEFGESLLARWCMPSQRARTICFWNCRSGRFSKSVLSVRHKEKKKMASPFIVLVQGKTLPRFHS